MNQELLHELFEYRDGELYWKVNKGRARVGMLASNKRPDGYARVGIDGKRYFAHRLIFLMHHGYLPKSIDHIDGNPSNNQLSNLREATHQQNSRNKKIQSNNESGTNGVHWHQQNKKWIVQIRIDGKSKHVGSFEDFELAQLVSAEARNKYYGDFVRK